MKAIVRFMEWATLLSAVAFILSVLYQIYARFFLESAPSWTEEASRFFFIYAMSFAAGLAMRDGEFVALDILYNKLGSNYKRVLDLAVPVLVTVLFLILWWGALEFVDGGISEKSPSIRTRMAWAFASILVMALSITLFSVKEVLNQLKRSK